MSKNIRANFWKNMALDELNQNEWEHLCDGCGKCCLIKLENEKTSEVHYTKIACRLFNEKNCRCGNYTNRKKLVSDCLIITRDTLKHSYQWMPSTCAYRLLYEGKELKPWHHLISGSTKTVHEVGISVKNSTVSECDIPEEHWGDYITPNF